ncbi:CDP-diacylglycerol--glycerol-3-phosphate 3-phosphatidyltransferase [Natronobacterium gregoryi]|nr:phosphatidylglycerophosphate synthase [Natronobacterium gregoryi SP2]SFJ40714.1 CDP-diacylglycerol--glycerol-3-phosphate 3-phosphatidyltransferase [Natronobacterium gregoryi]
MILASAVAVLALVAGSPVYAWSSGAGGPFVVGAVLGFVAVVVASWRSITLARQRVGVEPITPATWLTASRGGTLVILAGFLLIARPPDAFAWVPATLFAVAAGLDAVDGTLARATDDVSELGSRLDVEIDSLTVLVGTLLAIQYDVVPVAFLVVGLSRYAFVAGIRYRRWAGRPVYDLDPSTPRRVLGALAMVTIWLALSPIPGPAPTRVLAVVVLFPFVANFARDWLVVSGRRRHT